MLRTVLVVLVLPVLAVLSGCTPPRPWQNLTPERLARLEGHRQLAIAFLENSRREEATVEFRAIQKEEPSLAFGFLNEAATHYLEPAKNADVLKAARRGVELAPNRAWAHVILGRVLATNQPDEAVKSLEKAVSLAPDDPRVLGALYSQLAALPEDRSAQRADLLTRLTRAASNNLAVLCLQLQEGARRKDWSAAERSLDAVLARLARVPPDLAAMAEELRGGLRAGDARTAVVSRQFENVLKGSLERSHLPFYLADYQTIHGNPKDPADLLLRQWDVAPPTLAGPDIPAVSVRFLDVTQEAGLGDIPTSGLVPAAVGDYQMAPDSGHLVSGVPPPYDSAVKGEQKHYHPLMANPDLLVGGSPLGLIPGGPTGFVNSLKSVPAPASPLLADLNNDYTLDIYAASPSGDQVWFNPKAAESTQDGFLIRHGGLKPPVALPPRGRGSATAVDLDQDGDLDIVRASADPGQPGIRWMRNNRNGTFTDITARAGLSFPTQGARQTVAADFDRDGDPDLFVVQSGGPCKLFLNRRQESMHDATAEWGTPPEPGASAAVVVDLDRDGWWEIVVVGAPPFGPRVLRCRDGKLESRPIPFPEAARAEWIDCLDHDNDGWMDLVLAGPQGVTLLRNEQGVLKAGAVVPDRPARWVRSLDYDQDGDMDLLYAEAGGALRLLRNDGGNARPWLKLELRGLQKSGAESSNNYALGAVLEVESPWDHQQLLVTDAQTHIGLGRAERCTSVRVTWTNAIPLNLVGPKSNTIIHFEQTTSASCPFLYTWDGEQYRFATDFNWRSPLGMRFAPGAPIPHAQTRDWVRVPGDLLKPIAGFYRLIATEDLREIAYFDQLRLVALDHPPGTEVYLDERFRLGPPPPFRTYGVRTPRLPVAAHDGDGVDLLPALRAVDQVFTPVPSGPYAGIRREHDLVLELGEVPDRSRLTLFLNGWIWPSTTSDYIAASQDPGVKILPPRLSVGDGHGGWRLVEPGVGLPCGKRKTICLDLSGKLTPGDHRVKLSTTMEIRWDAAWFTSGEAEVEVRMTDAQLARADLGERGIGRMSRDGDDGPFIYDYGQTRPGSALGWPNIQGAYTRLGDCAELLGEVDDRFVIMGPGDEIRLLFDGRKLPPLPAGWRRDWIVFTDGWTKDTDANTVAGEAVGPLPYHGMRQYPYGPGDRFPDTPAHRRWQREWNTRLKDRW